MGGCPKCGGLLALVQDLGFREIKCLNCGKRVARQAVRVIASSRPAQETPHATTRLRAEALPPAGAVRRAGQRAGARDAHDAAVRARQRAYMQNYMRRRRARQGDATT